MGEDRPGHLGTTLTPVSLLTSTTAAPLRCGRSSFSSPLADSGPHHIPRFDAHRTTAPLSQSLPSNLSRRGRGQSTRGNSGHTAYTPPPMLEDCGTITRGREACEPKNEPLSSTPCIESINIPIKTRPRETTRPQWPPRTFGFDRVHSRVTKDTHSVVVFAHG
jgi:hypothetical protein